MGKQSHFDATAQRSVICSSRFIRYKPFQDDPEETANLYETALNGVAVAANVLAGLTVVGIIAVGEKAYDIVQNALIIYSAETFFIGTQGYSGMAWRRYIWG